jgi:hypothetical protein
MPAMALQEFGLHEQVEVRPSLFFPKFLIPCLFFTYASELPTCQIAMEIINLLKSESEPLNRLKHLNFQ